MPWEYSQSTGELKLDGITIGTGYSGAGKAKNKPSKEHLSSQGPIPRGEYEIKSPRNSSNTGPYVLPLEPVGHNALGRTDFQIHGDKIGAPGTASSGCIIMSPKSIRQKIWESGDRKLTVIQ